MGCTFEIFEIGPNLATVTDTELAWQQFETQEYATAVRSKQLLENTFYLTTERDHSLISNSFDDSFWIYPELSWFVLIYYMPSSSFISVDVSCAHLPRKPRRSRIKPTRRRTIDRIPLGISGLSHIEPIKVFYKMEAPGLEPQSLSLEWNSMRALIKKKKKKTQKSRTQDPAGKVDSLKDFLKGFSQERTSLKKTEPTIWIENLVDISWYVDDGYSITCTVGASKIWMTHLWYILNYPDLSWYMLCLHHPSSMLMFPALICGGSREGQAEADGSQNSGGLFTDLWVFLAASVTSGHD